MKYLELPIVNHVYINNPTLRIPLQLCPREEIVDPFKVLQLACAGEWITREDIWEVCKVDWTGKANYHEGEIRSQHFYVMGIDAREMIESMQYVETVEDMSCWLCKYSGCNVIFTSTVFENSEGRRMFYSSKYLGRTIFTSDSDIASSMDELEHMLDFKGFAIASGLILALAMNKARVWRGSILLPAVQRLVTNAMDARPNEEDLTPLLIPPWDDIYTSLYSEHIMQICDVPLLYASAGVDESIYNVMQEVMLPMDVFLQHFYNNTFYYTTHQSQAFPHLPWQRLQDTTSLLALPNIDNSDIESDIEGLSLEVRPDVAGLLMNIILHKKVWKHWRSSEAYQKQLLNSIFDGFEKADSAYEAIVVFMFHHYNNPCQGAQRVPQDRIRALWKCLFESRDGFYGWFFRKYCLKLLVNVSAYMPLPPIAFLRDFLDMYGSRNGFFNDTKSVFALDSATAGKLDDIFGVKRKEIPGTTKVCVVLETSHWCVWKELAKTHRPFTIFVRTCIMPLISAKMMCISEAFSGGAKHAVMAFMERAENRHMWL